jgi:hypothetical protein
MWSTFLIALSTAMLDYADINWDLPHTFLDYLPTLFAINELKNESLTTNVRPYSADTAFEKYEHDALHSQIKGSDVSFPHSFITHPIHSIPGNMNSEVVAYVVGGVAWDFALRHLLPEGVEGITAEIENNCNQTFSYHISGSDAFFIGEGAKHDTKYDHMKVTRSLLPSNTHPNLTKTPGHCFYSIVSCADISKFGMSS